MRMTKAFLCAVLIVLLALTLSCVDAQTTVAPTKDTSNPVLLLLQNVVQITAEHRAKVAANQAVLNDRLNRTDNGLLRSSGVSPVTVWPALVAGSCIGLGLTIAIYGYKLFRPTVFMSSFAFGAIVGYMTAERICAQDSSYFFILCWSVFAVCGLICGFVGLYMLSIGVGLVGATGGLVLAFLLTTSFGYKWWPSYTDGILFIFIGAFGLTFAILCYVLEKPFIIPMMALTGAAAAVWGVGYFAGGYACADDLSVYRTQNAFGTYSYSIPNSFWGYLGATVLLTIIGTFIQFLKTACCENNNLYTWETHPEIEMQQRRTYYNRMRDAQYGYTTRTRDNYYHAHNHRMGPY